MGFPIAVVLLLVVLVQIQGKDLEPGPQVLNDTTKLQPQSSQKRFATKEIILYLTPTQIRALQEGKGLISAQNVPHADFTNKPLKAPSLSAFSDHDSLVHPKPENGPPLHLAPVEELHPDQFVPITPPPEYQQFDNFAYFNLQPNVQPQFPKPIPFLADNNEKVLSDAFQHKELPTLIPHEPHFEKSQDNQLLRNQLKQQWYRLLDQNRAQLKALASLSRFHLEQPSHDPKKENLHYAPRYNENKNVVNFEHLITHHQQSQVERQQAAIQAEAIANSPPFIVHKEVNFKQNPENLIKHIKVPVPTPVLIPVPEPFEVKVPHPYPVPLEIIKEVPYPVYQTQKVEVEKPVPFEVEKHIPVPITKSVYVNVDRPYFVDRVVPIPFPPQKLEHSPLHKNERKN